jgi:hypothetical protein
LIKGMSASGVQRRRDALVDLVELRVSPNEAVAALRQLPWDSDVDLVLLSREHVLGLLTRYLHRELTPDDLEAWANAVEGREDLGALPGDEELLRAFVFETANPSLNEPISDAYAHRWLERLGGER